MTHTWKAILSVMVTVLIVVLLIVKFDVDSHTPPPSYSQACQLSGPPACPPS